MLDDWGARQIAENRGLNVAGLLRVLEIGAIHEHIDLRNKIRILRGTNFRISEALLTKVLRDFYKA